MVNSLRKVDFSHPAGHYTWKKSPPPPALRKSWVRPCVHSIETKPILFGAELIVLYAFKTSNA